MLTCDLSGGPQMIHTVAVKNERPPMTPGLCVVRVAGGRSVCGVCDVCGVCVWCVCSGAAHVFGKAGTGLCLCEREGSSTDVYVRACVRVRVRVYVRACACVRACVHVCMRARARTCVRACVYAPMRYVCVSS